MKNKIFITIFIVGLVAFLWPLSGILLDLNSWQGWDQPAMLGKLIRCLIASLVAIGGALGIDVKSLLGNVLGTKEVNNVEKA